MDRARDPVCVPCLYPYRSALHLGHHWTIQNASISTAKLLLDRGLDLDQYREWAEEHGESCKYPEVISELLDYTREQQTQGPQMGEMSL